MECKRKSKWLWNRGAQLAAFASACFLSLVVLFCVPAWTQAGIPSSTPTVPQPEVPKDALGRTTPRGTVFGFLSAAHKGDFELAARYLNTGFRGKATTDLARQFFVVLDRRLPARLNAISDLPEGSHSNPLKPDEDVVGTVMSAKGDIDIIVERVDRGKPTGPVWIFSSKTLESIPDLFAELEEVPVESVLPGFLVNTRLAGIVLFEWLAVFVGMPLFYLLTTLVSRSLNRLIGQWRRRLYGNPDLPDPHVLPIPVRILLLAAVIRWLLTVLSLPLLARQFWSSTSIVITTAGSVWLLILVNGWAETFIRRHLRGVNLTGTASMLRLARRTIDGLIIFVGVLVTLYHFGVQLTAALAGLSIGGIAIAFAAQKTLENVIGGISLILDRAVRIGDTLRVGETLGTVDDIGLRSTRIRTLDRTMVTVPNGQIANLSLENLSARDKFWLHPILRLRYGTTEGQMHALLASIRALLEETRFIDPPSVRVRFLSFGSSCPKLF
jgi:MscS family membrane protein